MYTKKSRKLVRKELLSHLKLKWEIDYEESKYLKKICFSKFLLHVMHIPVITYKTQKLFLILQRLSLSG